MPFKFVGVLVDWKIVQGQTAGPDEPTVIVTALEAGGVPAVSIFPVSSNPRLLIVTVPLEEGVHVKLQLVVPVATCHVTPPSTETSTPATTPPASEAVPAIVIAVPLLTVAPSAGELIVVTGAWLSEEAVAAINPLCNVAG